MTRLFLRFYVGVILILLVAWMIQGYVFRTRIESDGARVVEEALSGGVRMANYYVSQNWPENTDKVLRDLNGIFDYDVRIVAKEARPLSAEAEQRLQDGEEVLVDGTRMVSRITDSEYQLELGPLPQFSGPTQTDILIVLGVISLLAAFAIAVLLRPVAMQLRAIERSATGIANGNLDSRVDLDRWPASLPLASAFNQMAERTQGLLQSQRELLQAVSHELRTPLAKIRFATDLIGVSQSAVERDERLESVDKATTELDQLVGELLTYVRLDSEASRPQHEMVDVGDLLADIMSDQQLLTPQVQFTIRNDAVGQDSATLHWQTDVLALKRAVKNLVGNAAKFAKSTVEISATRSGSSLIISVDDDGPGIEPEHRDRIFEPFVRVSDQSVRGVGLGLALVQRIVNRLSGDVQVGDSHLGGARFRVEFNAIQ